MRLFKIGEFDNKPFSHISPNGTTFNAHSCKFNKIIFYRKSKTCTEQELMVDVAEMIAYHAVNILPYLSSFNGYNSLKFLEKIEL